MSPVKKILVVDDNPVDRHLVGSLLGKLPKWEIEFASDGAAAMACLDSYRPDIVVTDMQMPYVDGLQLVKNIRNNYPHVPVMLITSHGSEKTSVEALKCGAASYTPKSALSSDLVRTVKQVLQMSEHSRISTYPRQHGLRIGQRPGANRSADRKFASVVAKLVGSRSIANWNGD
jgi:DNA-binding NtrC family response regulator